MQKKLKEFQQPTQGAPAPAISMDDLMKDYKNIKTLISLLEPRSSRDTEILSLLKRLNKSVFTKVKNLKGEGETVPVNSTDPGIMQDNQSEIEETTSVAGGALQGTAGGIKIDEPVRESRDVTTFRQYIRGLLKELYDLDRNTFLENSKQLITEFLSTKSTGINYLGRFFLVARPIIEKEYLDLQTSQDQKDSMRDNLIKLYTDAISQLLMNANAANTNSEFNSTNESFVIESTNAQSMDGIYFDDFGFKDPVKEKEKKKKNGDEKMPDTHPNSEPTGAAAAGRVFQATSKQLEEIFSSLGNPDDQQMFAQYLPKNVIALFHEMANSNP